MAEAATGLGSSGSVAVRIVAFGGLGACQMSPACGMRLQSWLLATTGVAAGLAVARPTVAAERVVHLPLPWKWPSVAELFGPLKVLAEARPGGAALRSCFRPGRH